MVIDYEVILATFNGERYILQQLKSIESQTILPTRIIISDDGSTDSTLEIIRIWQKSTKLSVNILPCSGVRLGSCKNFERLLAFTSSDYVMLSDQDDVWKKTKAESLLSEMIKLENSTPTRTPLLVYSDLSLIDNDGLLISSSFYRYQRLNPFKNDWISLSLQNVVTGCSSLINSSCINLALPFPDEVILHDWWLALVASRNGTTSLVFDDIVSYRQHDDNVIGAKGFFRLVLNRLYQFFNFKSLDHWIGLPLHQMRACSERFPSDNTLESQYIKSLFSPSSIIRLLAAFELGLSKHGLLRTIGFYIALLFWNPSHH